MMPLSLSGFLCVVLGVLSVVTLQSFSAGLAHRQLGFVVISLIIFWLTRKIPFKTWVYFSGWFYVLGVVALLALFLGNTTRGIYGWFAIGTYGLQPSQFFLPVMSLLAFGRIKLTGMKVKTFLLILCLTVLPAGLISLQPDFGTAMILTLAVGSSLIFLRWSKRWALVFGASLILVAVVGWTWFLKPYQKKRVTAFFDASATSYQSTQALIAVGSGGIWGTGLGHGSQSQLRFLPEKSTDFIFAAFAEEWGFVGTTILILIYATGAVYFFSACNNRDDATLVFIWIVGVAWSIQSGINIGMNLGLLPITGIPLPLFSYGGSSLISWAWWLGLVSSALQKRVIIPTYVEVRSHSVAR